MSEQPTIIASGGNVFEDLGVAEPETALAKADLAIAIASIVAQRGWTQEEAAAALGIDQPKISALMNGRLAGFSFERLMRFLNRLDYDVRLTVTQATEATGHTSVQFTAVSR
jgi:predicted XRE-type DNA-binding protein